LVFQREFAPRVAGVLDELPMLRHAIVIEDGSGTDLGGLDAVDFEAAVASGSPERDFGPRSPDDRYILYTGGTTGMPKGVVWRHEDITTAVVRDPAARLAPHMPPGAEALEQIVQLSLGPLMHASGQWSVLGALCHGGKVILMPE